MTVQREAIGVLSAGQTQGIRFVGIVFDPVDQVNARVGNCLRMRHVERFSLRLFPNCRESLKFGSVNQTSRTDGQ